MKKLKLTTVIFYIAILALLFSWIFGLFGGTVDNITRSQITTMIQQGQVKRFVVEGEYIKLKMYNPDDGKKELVGKLADPEGFLLTMYDSRLRLANQIYDEVKRHFRELVFRTVIQRNVKLSEAPSHGLPVLHYDVDSAGARNHLALAQEIIEKNEKQN